MPLRRCQLRIEYLARQVEGRWDIKTQVVEPESYAPLSEQERMEIRAQARDDVGKRARPGFDLWSQFVFTRVDCLRN